MREDKNILKPNNRVSSKPKHKKDFYAVIEVNVKNEITGKSSVKSVVIEHTGTRIEAKKALEGIAKAQNGTLIHFGAFKNQ